MADIVKTPSLIRPLIGAVIERYTAGGSGSLGDLVYEDANGNVQVTDADAAGTTYGFGIVISAPNGATTFVSGDALDVCVFGRVTGFSGMTPHDVLYASNTAGAIADAAGTTSHKVGRARSATVLFVNPPLTEA